MFSLMLDRGIARFQRQHPRASYCGLGIAGRMSQRTMIERRDTAPVTGSDTTPADGASWVTITAPGASGVSVQP
ncbi:hypothetical protein ACFVSU_11415, partial [Microbacterium sp. NPDC058062]|uniref:hypothetical protein n=1 Tax=Microbacterium sp. NPDC058062 TaxID=3346320 RepID=UPI0036DB596D